MRLQDIVQESDQQLNEFLPALAAGAARVGSAVGGMVSKGAQAVGTAVGKGAMQAAIGSAMPATSNDPKIQGAMLAQQRKQTQDQRKAIQDQITAVTKQLTDLRKQLAQIQ
jgi:hypothetical protein